MNMTSSRFSDSRYGPIEQYTLENEELSVTILSLGGIVQKLIYRGKDLVCGFDDAEAYLNSGCYYGALVGRCCNRMAHLRIGDKEHPISLNENGNTHLHGGFCGMDRKIWQVIPEKNSLRLLCHLSDGEEGYPGNLDIEVRYALEGSTLRIAYQAVSDQDTAVNFTNHSYFNLNGLGGTILNHTLYLPADAISECDQRHIPTGRHLPCAGTPLDFNTPKRIGQDIQAAHPQLTPWGGYDNNYLLRKEKPFAQCARIVGERIGDEAIALEVFTDLPCVQLYTANDHHDAPMKGGIPQIRNRAFCIETQLEPNSMNFANQILRAGTTFQTETQYRFSVQ